jgi:glycosyltransferase involved in cell wall biosynthesis
MTLTVVIIAKNNERIIAECIKSARGFDKIILVDSGSVDRTCQIAKKLGAQVIYAPGQKLEFARWRNIGLKNVKSDWVFYLDTDERMTRELTAEIKQVIGRDIGEEQKSVAYKIPRRNFYLGQEMHYGGAWPDYVKRLFLKKSLKGWQRDLHEDPIIDGDLGRLKNPLIHVSHRDLSSSMEKTRRWSEIEARLLLEANHPPVVWWRFFRIMLTEFWLRAVRLQGWRDGTPGWIEIIFQMFSRFITYARLWEMQNKSCLPAGRVK